MIGIDVWAIKMLPRLVVYYVSRKKLKIRNTWGWLVSEAETTQDSRLGGVSDLGRLLNVNSNFDMKE